MVGSSGFPGGNPELIPTGIGSLPHCNPEAALDLVQACVPELPYWPQLPLRDPTEGMQRQFLAGLPGVVSEEDLMVNEEEAVAGAVPLYRAAMSGGGWVLPSGSRASCLHAMTEREWAHARAVKGQIVGPVTLGMSLRDENRVPLLHSAQMRELLVHHLAMSAAMQWRHLGSTGRPVVLFFDEPYMSIYGTAQFPLRDADILSMWQDMRAGLRCTVGIHCCGATDWSLVAKGTFDILSFDAFDYSESLLAHSPEVAAFVEGGGVLAWGIIPSSDRIREFAAEDLVDMWVEQAERLVDGRSGLALADLASSSMVTPACGLGTLEISTAEEIFWRLSEVSHILRERFSF